MKSIKLNSERRKAMKKKTLKKIYAQAVKEAEMTKHTKAVIKAAKKTSNDYGTWRVVNVRDDDTVITIMRFGTFDEADAYRKLLEKGDKNAYENDKPINFNRYFVLDY